ncbi:tctex1 domain-containing protein 1 [Platysternon megacephalum]|uniref:Tctex1 domain-containing protein 1 n=1 Tax=Platysternon megacephalum TaxID=55544 RepID=A0A4D9DGD0_9SAUR|nr:tctex1 domain-containing protein 1 [Platysternon megacephalum]
MRGWREASTCCHLGWGGSAPPRTGPLPPSQPAPPCGQVGPAPPGPGRLEASGNPEAAPPPRLLSVSAADARSPRAPASRHHGNPLLPPTQPGPGGPQRI